MKSRGCTSPQVGGSGWLERLAGFGWLGRVAGWTGWVAAAVGRCGHGGPVQTDSRISNVLSSAASWPPCWPHAAACSQPAAVLRWGACLRGAVWRVGRQQVQPPGRRQPVGQQHAHGAEDGTWGGGSGGSSRRSSPRVSCWAGQVRAGEGRGGTVALQCRDFAWLALCAVNLDCQLSSSLSLQCRLCLQGGGSACQRPRAGGLLPWRFPLGGAGQGGRAGRAGRHDAVTAAVRCRVRLLVIENCRVKLMCCLLREHRALRPPATWRRQMSSMCGDGSRHPAHSSQALIQGVEDCRQA